MVVAGLEVAVVAATKVGSKASVAPQLDSKSNVAKSLTMAACSCLGIVAAAPALAQDSGNTWDMTTSILYYGESDDRVQDASLAFYAQRHFTDQRELTLGLTVDTLTGASASGAIALDRPQTFTSPSGNATYTTAANEIPLDDTFLDTRFAVTAGWSQPLGEDYSFGVGLSASQEYDYFHLGANASIARAFNKNNTTVSAGFAIAQDTIDPEGGAPIGLALMGIVGDNSNKQIGDQDKDVVDLLLGVSQVINRNAVMQFNYSYSDSSGYLTDPFKILSVVDGVTGDTLPQLLTVEGPDGIYRFEKRPDSRTKHSLYSQLKYFIDGQVLDVSYRYMTDDWDIDSHTVDLRYRVPFSGFYVEPHVRFYTQSEASFYRSSLVDGDPLPQFASADYRLGDFDAMTFGVKLGKKLSSGNEWSTRIEYYRQSGDIPSSQIIGNQANREQYPDLNAVIAQFSYKFGF